jgi:hypothetical protein
MALRTPQMPVCVAEFGKYRDTGLVGGGSTPTPGEMSQAHNGLLLWAFST